MRSINCVCRRGNIAKSIPAQDEDSPEVDQENDARGCTIEQSTNQSIN